MLIKKWQIAGSYVEETIYGPFATALNNALSAAIIETEYPKKDGQIATVKVRGQDEMGRPIRVLLTLQFKVTMPTKT